MGQTSEPVSGQDPDVYCMMQTVDLRLPVALRTAELNFALITGTSREYYTVFFD